MCPCRNRNLQVQMESEIARLAARWKRIFLYVSTKKSFQLRSANAFYNLPPIRYFMPELQFQVDIWQSEYLVFRLVIGVRQCTSSPKMKCSFLDYIQLLIISWVMKVDRNTKKALLVIKKWNAHFWIIFNIWLLAEWSEWWKLTEMQKRPP